MRSVFHRLCDADFASLSTRVAARVTRGNTTVFKARRLQDVVVPEPWSTVSGALLVCFAVAALALFLGARTVRRRDFALKD